MRSNLKLFTRIAIIAIASTLGGNAVTYAEANEVGNGTETNSEGTAYALDMTGQRIAGSLEASGTTLATSFTDIEEWQPEKLYHRGDVVRINYDIYISTIPSKGLTPDTLQSRGFHRARA